MAESRLEISRACAAIDSKYAPAEGNADVTSPSHLKNAHAEENADVTQLPS